MNSLYEDSTFNDEWDLSEEEDTALILALHMSNRPKHGGSVFGHEKLKRERIERHNKLI
jgi:hypothetical protein